MICRKVKLKVSLAKLTSEEERIELQGVDERSLLASEKLAESYNQMRREEIEGDGEVTEQRGSEKEREK